MSGKSALLKLVGCIVIMAQAGSFVPADAATIGVVDRIFTRLETCESSSVLHESTFSIDVQQLARMLRFSTRNSLLLIDEFGKGTAAVDGASLLIASLNTLTERNTQCPRTIVSSSSVSLPTQLLHRQCPISMKSCKSITLLCRQE